MIAGAFPSLVNYLPNKTHLTSDTAPPPSNPKLQECLENYIFADYDLQWNSIETSIERIKTANIAYLPGEYQDRLNDSYAKAGKTFAMVEKIRSSASELDEYSIEYRPLHLEVRQLQKSMRQIDRRIKELEQDKQRLSFEENVPKTAIDDIDREISSLEINRNTIAKEIPGNWQPSREKFESLAKVAKRARQAYRQNVDESYEAIVILRRMLSEHEQLEGLMAKVEPLVDAIHDQQANEAMETIKAVESEIDLLTETHQIKSRLSKARRALRGNSPKPDKAIEMVLQAVDQLKLEITWRNRAAAELSTDLEEFDQAIANTIGMRMQERLSTDQAESIASCLAVHKDLSLHF